MAELILGISLGFAAGVSPGPLLTLVVVTAIQRGPAAAVRVAMAPLVTDTSVILLALLLLTNVPDRALTALSIVGGLYLIGLGLMTVVRSAELQALDLAGSSRDIVRGVAVNFLSPHPWVFWVTAGGPLLVEAWRAAPARGLVFLGGFYALIVGTKAFIGWSVGRTRHLIDERWRQFIVRIGGALLIAAGVWLIL